MYDVDEDGEEEEGDAGHALLRRRLVCREEVVVRRWAWSHFVVVDSRALAHMAGEALWEHVLRTFATFGSRCPPHHPHQRAVFWRLGGHAIVPLRKPRPPPLPLLAPATVAASPQPQAANNHHKNKTRPRAAAAASSGEARRERAARRKVEQGSEVKRLAEVLMRMGDDAWQPSQEQKKDDDKKEEEEPPKQRRSVRQSPPSPPPAAAECDGRSSSSSSNTNNDDIVVVLDYEDEDALGLGGAPRPMMVPHDDEEADYWLAQ